MKRIAVLGATGSIGRQTLEIVRRHPDRLSVCSLAGGTRREALSQAAEEFGVRKTALMSEDGIDAISELAADPEADIVVVAVAGVVGLLPTLAAIRSGKRVAIASKEVLVAAGGLVIDEAKRTGAEITPIDSEHSAVLQCIHGEPDGAVAKITITASGGPFRGWTRSQLEAVTPEMALNHPTWRMGGKITVDSATLMNKGLETIEALWLYGLNPDQVDVIVHPQSIVHSFVTFTDGSVLAQLGAPSMLIPIQYALFYPERFTSGVEPYSPFAGPPVTFETFDPDVFRLPGIAKRSFESGGTAPCVMNAANELAANAFLQGRCSFLQIEEIVESTLSQHSPVPVTLESVLESDAWARESAGRLLASE